MRCGKYQKDLTRMSFDEAFSEREERVEVVKPAVHADDLYGLSECIDDGGVVFDENAGECTAPYALHVAFCDDHLRCLEWQD